VISSNKDAFNLKIATRNWHGSSKCYFCEKYEAMQNLFTDCPSLKILWHIVHISFNISPPKNIKNLFENWLHKVEKLEKKGTNPGGLLCFIVGYLECKK
jgi:hypothetical protein